MLQVITHNTGHTEIIRNYRKPSERLFARFIFRGHTRQEYQALIDKIYRVLNDRELRELLKKSEGVTDLTIFK